MRAANDLLAARMDNIDVYYLVNITAQLLEKLCAEYFLCR